MVLKLHSIWHYAQYAPYTWLTALLLCVSSYLCLVNLDYSLLWSDEANTALIGNNLLQTGTLTAWDGRNLVSNIDGMNINSDAKEVLPPLQYLFSALGISMFGLNELGARSVHAFIGVLALIMLLLLLKLHLPNSSRLIFLIMLFVCLSPQLLLYFRSARYFSFVVFSFIACIYFYEKFWRSNHYRYLISLAVMGLLSFLNHYTIAIAGILTIGFYHIVFRVRATNKKQSLYFALSTAFIVVIGGAYLYSAGVLPIDHNMHDYYGVNKLTWSDHMLKIWRGIREIFSSDWLSWVVCIWFLIQWRFNQERYTFIPTRRLICFGFSAALLSMQLSPHEINDFRFYIASLPLLLIMKGFFIHWLLDRSKVIAYVLLAALLFSSAGAAPFNLINYYTGESTHGFWLSSFVQEIHQPYRPDPVEEVSRYLKKHARKDDLVFVNHFGFREALVFYAGDHVLFCCQIETDNHRLTAVVRNMRNSLFHTPNIIPDWIIITMPDIYERWQYVMKDRYHHNWELINLPIHARRTQRPEIDFHTFEPYPDPVDGGIVILKRKENAASDTWF